MKTHVSHKWLYHLDACAGSVLAPHDDITNVQERRSNRSYTCFDQCINAQKRLGNRAVGLDCACVKGLRMFTSLDAARLWMCVWRAPMQHTPLFNEKRRITEGTFRTGQWKFACGRMNLAVCSRYRIMPQWAINISKRPPAQMETRSTNCPFPTKSSNDTSSPAQHIIPRIVAFLSDS